MSQIGCQPAAWQAVDNNFAKLATMGVSIIFASGTNQMTAFGGGEGRWGVLRGVGGAWLYVGDS